MEQFGFSRDHNHNHCSENQILQPYPSLTQKVIVIVIDGPVIVIVIVNSSISGYYPREPSLLTTVVY